MSQERDAAETLFRLLDGQAVATPALERASGWFEALDTPLDRRSFMAYVEVLQRPLPASSPLASLAPKWRQTWRRQGRFSEREAAAFLQDYRKHLDPNLLFRAPITAGRARWTRSQLQGGFSYGSRSEQGWSLLFCESGGASLRASGRTLALEEGLALLVTPGALYSLQPHASHRQWRYYWIVFQPDSRWRDWLHWPEFASQIGCLTLPETDRERMRNLLGDLVSCLRSEAPLTAELSHNLLEQVILRCRGSLPHGYRQQRDPRIERAREFIDAHYAGSFSLEEVARAANLSPSRLAGLFRSQCGLSVLGYRDELRMGQAARLLNESTLSVAAIGAAVGYPDPAYFSRIFSRHVGVSPRSYAQRYRLYR